MAEVADDTAEVPGSSGSSGNSGRSSSGGSQSGSKSGNKSGGGVVFKFPRKTIAGPGRTVMSVSPSNIVIEFSVVQDSGETLNLHVAFAKA